jgi:hypothetical protein
MRARKPPPRRARSVLGRFDAASHGRVVGSMLALSGACACVRWCFRENARPSPPAASIHMLRAGGAAAPRVWPPSGRLQEQARRGLSLALPSAPPDRVYSTVLHGQPSTLWIGRKTGPLPSGWERHTRWDGKIYYVNHHSHTTQWAHRGPVGDPPPHDPVECNWQQHRRSGGIDAQLSTKPKLCEYNPQPTVAAQMLAEAATLQDQIEGGCWPCRQ